MTLKIDTLIADILVVIFYQRTSPVTFYLFF